MKTLQQFYEAHEGKVSDKWKLYLEEYDRLFGAFRDKPINLLEIGIQNGGSLEIWAKYFEQANHIVGCDINEDCAALKFDDPRISVVVGDANSDVAQSQVVVKSSDFDLIIDDGSHRSSDIIKTFSRYFRHIVDGGLFVAEDLHCSYWREFEGGLFHPFSAISFFKRLADLINYEHWGIDQSKRELVLSFAQEYQVDFDEQIFDRVHSIEFVNSMCIVRALPHSHNVLGHRRIAGQIESVVQILNLPIEKISHSPEQQENEWSQPPTDITERLLAQITERDLEIHNLEQLLSDRDQLLHDRDQLLHDRDQLLHDRNQLLHNRDQQISSFLNSRSYKLTVPLRFSLNKVRQLKHALEILRPLIEQSKADPKTTLTSVLDSVRRDGFKGTALRLRRKLKGLPKSQVSQKGNKMFAFISGCPGDAFRYRCIHQSELLSYCGYGVDVFEPFDFDFDFLIRNYKVIVAHRIPHTVAFEDFVNRADRAGVKVVYDTDDLVFNPQRLPEINAYVRMEADEKKLYRDGVERYQKSLGLCSAVMVSTDRLKLEVSKVFENKLVEISRNRASITMEELAHTAMQSPSEQSKSSDTAIRLGYFSGSKTHDRDFLESIDGIRYILDKFETVVLVVVGHLSIPDDFRTRYESRIEIIGFLPWQKLPEIYKTIDINLSPLEVNNSFTDSKSELKFIEAGLVKVPTVASAVSAYEFAIQNGVDGLLCYSPSDWITSLEAVVEDSDFRLSLGCRAYDKVASRYLTRYHPGEVVDAWSSLVKFSSGALKVAVVMRAPIASTGGGYQKIFQLSSFLAHSGHEVHLYIEPIAHLAGMSELQVRDFCRENFGDSPAIVHSGHEDIAPCDVIVATNWPTAFTVANFQLSRLNVYFVQDYEPLFYEEEDTNYLAAESTYDLPLKIVSIGKYLSQLLGERNKKTYDSINFCIDEHFFFPEDCLSKHESDENELCVIFFARPHIPRRNFSLGVQALTLFHQLHPDVVIKLYGLDEEMDLPFPYQNLGILSKSDLALEMLSSHIHLSFSMSNVSTVIYEAMACGCAAVEVDIPAVSSMVEPEKNCLLSEPEPDSVCSALSTLVRDPQIRIGIAVEGHQYAQDLSVSKMCAQFEALLFRYLFMTHKNSVS